MAGGFTNINDNTQGISIREVKLAIPAVLAGALVDDDGTFAVVEAERRLGEAWKIELEARLFINVTAQDPLLSGVRDDSFVTLRLARYL